MSKDPNINSIIDYWINTPDNYENITHIQTKKEFSGNFYDIPEFLNPELILALKNNGISKLFSHQYEALNSVFGGKNVVITTGPSSGKSLIYLLPVLNNIFNGDNSTALFLYPTKALAYDQYKHINDFIDKSSLSNKAKIIIKNKINVYDGDTPKEYRSIVRKQSQIILSNPDMLHIGILPNHDLWEQFFEKLSFIILDEAHIYRGIFGSHVANVIRRLKRIENLYSHKPRFICTSATIGNPQEFMNKLVEEEFDHIYEDGSPQGGKKIVFYNPPIINSELGIRKSKHQETIRIVEELTSRNVQTLIFQSTRKEVEKSLKNLQENVNSQSLLNSSAYRSGYLAQDRRKLEEDFRTGKLKILFSTNALELGVDIGGLQCVILSGYPGSIASTLQQIGRAGRSQADSLAIIIAGSYPIDQYIIKRPEYLLLKNPEKALINPDNPKILLEHLRLTISELSMLVGENFGKLTWDQLEPYLETLKINGFVDKNKNKYSLVYSSENESISLRNMNGKQMKLIDVSSDENRIFGEIDYLSSLWMVHPNAIYLHLGEQYIVSEVDFSSNQVMLQKYNSNYYTEPKMEKTYEIIEQDTLKVINDITLLHGNIKVTQTVKGYKELLWENNQKISENELDMPETVFETESFWFSIPESIKNTLIEDNLWLNYQNDYGPHWKDYKNLIRKRDNYTCQNCGSVEENLSHHIHHIKPIKLFESIEIANHPTNLITLCPACHRLAETQVRVRSGMSGFSFLLKTLSPLFIMCGSEDIDVIIDSNNSITGSENSILIYDNIAFGLGLSLELYNNFEFILPEMYKHVQDCGCHHGCPSCVGPISNDGYGGKEETVRLLELLIEAMNGS